MRHLLALLDADDLAGTHETRSEPIPNPGGDLEKSKRKQSSTRSGTPGTHGTPQFQQSAEKCDLSGLIADLADAYDERVAMCLEGGDMTEDEARKIAEAEVGGELARRLCWESRT
jgi:hypothetical protein